ncbi:MAG: hypothetical protein AB1714_14940 [Acidobacteriota bacterium]
MKPWDALKQRCSPVKQGNSVLWDMALKSAPLCFFLSLLLRRSDGAVQARLAALAWPPMTQCVATKRGCVLARRPPETTQIPFFNFMRFQAHPLSAWAFLSLRARCKLLILRARQGAEVAYNI